ncbi:MAG: lysostaphin resistance A-like protein [Planctomycetota bacterium]|jgi:membrane protease YdiL (CAAX protease family)
MDNQLPSPRSLVLLAVVFEGGLGLLALPLGQWLGSPALETYRWLPSHAFGGAGAGVAMLLLLLLGLRFSVWPFSDVRRVVEELLVPLFRRCGLLELAVISVLAGLGEEMLFRGVIQKVAEGWADGPTGTWVGLVTASALFGLAHPLTFSYIVMAGLMGLYLGWLWIATENLLVPITAHAVYDFLALVYLAKVRGRRLPAADPEEPDVPSEVPAAGDDVPEPPHSCE